MEIRRFYQFIKESEDSLKPTDLKIVKDEGRECMILRDEKTDKLWFFYYDHIDKEDFSAFGDVEKTYIGKDEDGDPEYEYDYENYEPTPEDKLEYIKFNLGKFQMGKGIEGYERGDDLVEIDQMLAHTLLDTFPKFSPKELRLL